MTLKLNHLAINRELLAIHSEFFKNLFQYEPEINEVTYPYSNDFTFQCFKSSVFSLGTFTNSKTLNSFRHFHRHLSKFTIRNLFNVANYLVSKTLFNYLCFDRLTPDSAAILLFLTVRQFGEQHHYVDTIVMFLKMSLNIPYSKSLALAKSSRVIRQFIRNKVRLSNSFNRNLSLPAPCLCCNQIIEDFDAFSEDRLVTMSCCHQIVHLNCQKRLLRRTFPACPYCDTPYYLGKIDFVDEDLHSVLNRNHINNYNVPPLALRLRTDIFPTPTGPTFANGFPG